MKFKIIAAAVIILTVSTLVACADKNGDAVNANATSLVQTTASEASTAEATVISTQATALPVSTTELKTTTAVSSTKKPVESTKNSAEKTTVKATKPVTAVSGSMKFTDNVVEKEELKYGVVLHTYKTIYYQLVNGEKRVYNTETTGYRFNRSNYSASYEDLLPAARKNREKYRDYINENLKIINGYRAEKGRAPLVLDEKLCLVAGARAEEIAWSGVQGHKRPDGSDCFALLREAGYSDGIAGENLGYVFDYPADVCLAWKQSRTHYNNLMDEDFVKIGIGVAADPDEAGKLIWVNHFMS